MEKNAAQPGTGRLILCATPIGNLGDITERVRTALAEADLIAAEDTRNSMKLLSYLGIQTPMTSYHEHNRREKGAKLVERMLAGQTIALVTDAGTPAISDPGEDLVRLCQEAKIPVTSLPGPAACITALTLSGLPARRFCFEGFLPADKKEREEVLAQLKNEKRTIVLYEAPHRLVKTLSRLARTLGGSRELALCRELTKRHEEVLRTTIDAAIQMYEQQEPRGEYVLVIAGRPAAEIAAGTQAFWEELAVLDHLQIYLEQGIDKKEAMKRVAKDRGISRRDVYQALLENGG